MPRYLILAQSEVTATALNGWIQLLGEVPLKPDDSRWIVWRPRGTLGGGEGGVLSFEELARTVEAAALEEDEGVRLNNVIALVDSVRPSGLSPMTEGESWDNQVAMLILTFPEIRWVFGVVSGKADAFPTHSHSLVSLVAKPRFDPILDGSGLRDFVRGQCNAALERAKDDLRLPLRPKRAATIDEEKGYAYLHGYAAYRFGCRTDVITSWALMKERFGGRSEKEDEAKAPQKGHGYWLLLEDMSLNFPDRETDIHLLQFAKAEPRASHGRADHCPMLDSTDPKKENSAHRILVTSGNGRPGATVLPENLDYLEAKKEGRGGYISKPAGGMLDLWREARLLGEEQPLQLAGNVPGFDWPPGPPSERSPALDGAHGAPGKLTLIAEALIRRAQRLIDEVDTVEQSVFGAVLATDALELTGCRTPTTAVEALRLKHRFEVLAECQFSGVQHHIRVKERLHEVRMEVQAVSFWYGPERSRAAALNAEMDIVVDLMRVFEDYGQFNEERLLLAESRTLHRRLLFKDRMVCWGMNGGGSTPFTGARPMCICC